MRRNKGRRFDDEPRLNIKKVIATIVALLVIIMVISSIIMLINKKNKNQEIPKALKYFSAYTNSKWTVINSKGEQLENVLSDEMIIVPNSEKPVFIVTYDVNYSDGTFKTKAVNEKNETIFKDYLNVSAIVNYRSVNDVWYDTEVLKFEKDGKLGLIDFTGKQVLEPEYDEISSMMGIEKTLILKKDEKIGLYNSVSKSKFVENVFNEIQPFGKTYNDGYIVKNDDGKYGLISSEGTTVLNNKFDKIFKVYGAEKYVVENGLKTELIDKNENVLLDSGFDEIAEINGDTLVIKKAGKYGIITIGGEVLIDPAFDTLKNCFSDYYIASTAGNYGIIDLSKNIQIEFKYKDIEYRNDIISLICQNEDYTTDVYTRDLQLVFTGTISKVDSEKGYIRARIGDEYKYYNLQYQEISNKDALKGNSLFLVRENGKYGYENKDGQRIVDCIYDDATEQNEFGFCAINKDGKWGVLQENGSILLEPSISLDDNIIIDFIGKWHLNENTELNSYVQ